MPRYVPGIGPFAPKLFVIGDYPGRHEDEQGIPFCGPTGQMLSEFLYKAGISRSDCYITNVLKYRPPLNDPTKMHLIGAPDLEQSAKDLWDKEITPNQPNCILAIGSYAMRAVMGWPLDWNKKKDGYNILNYRGSILRSKNPSIKCVPTINPAALFNRYNSEEQTGGLDYVYSKLIQHDVSRAVQESLNPNFNLPDRDLNVCTNSLNLFRFFQEYKSSSKVAVDIESINCIPVCVGFAFNPNHAISVPLFHKIGPNTLTDMGNNELNECWKLIDQALRTKQIIGQNFKYDDFKLGLTGFKCENVYSDTLIKTRVLFPELSDKRLCTISSLWTREPYYKDEGKEPKFGKFNVNQFFIYNARDCAVDFEIDQAQEIDLLSMQETYHVPLVEYYYNYMMRKHKFYLRMENNGFRVDDAKQRELKSRYTMMQEDVHERLIARIGHDLNVKSAPQKYDLLYKELKFKAYKTAPTSEDSIVKLISTHCKGKDGNNKKLILEDILEETRIRDQISRNINFTPDYDGRCKTSFNISATETCRSSTGVIKKPLRPKKLGLAFHTISKHGRLAKDIRSMFIPDPGKVFIQADSSQAEARVVAVLSKDWDLLEAFDKIDIHRRTAGLVFGMTVGLNLSTNFVPLVDELEKDGPERFTGKTTRHAGNYLMGKARHMQEFNTSAQKAGINMSISEWRAGENLRLFHEASPKLSSNFHADIIETINSTRCLIDPFGGVRIFNGRWDDDIYKEGFANIPQRTVAHLVQGAGLAVYEEVQDDTEVMFLSENHDSLLMQVPAGNWEPYAKLLKNHMERLIDFGLYCSLRRDYKLKIPCDIELSDTNYSEMKKVKI